jgi:hypothetical protein
LCFTVVVQEWGYEVTGFIAGLGLGGLAFALAAKDAISNIFGGIVIIQIPCDRSGERVYRRIETCSKAIHEDPVYKTEDGTKALVEKEWPNIRVKLGQPPNATRNPENKDEIIAGRVATTLYK